MDERHRAQRVVDAVLAVGERVLDRQHEARAELAERTAGVHQRRRVGLEAALRHQAVELLRRLLHRAVARAVPSIRLGDDRRHAPEQILGLLDRFSLFVLHQVALFEHGARVGESETGPGGGLTGSGMRRLSLKGGETEDDYLDCDGDAGRGWRGTRGAQEEREGATVGISCHCGRGS